MTRPYVLAETTWKTVDATPYSVAILPWGATEAHNYHLPYATDNIQAEQIAIRAAERAWNRGARVVVLPTVPVRRQHDAARHQALPEHESEHAGGAARRPGRRRSTQQGIHKLLILNGHGGNDFRQIIRELQPKTRVFLSTINWWSCVDVKQFVEEAGDHAGEAETSAMMHLAPELVRPLGEAGPGHARAVATHRQFARAGRGRRGGGRRSRPTPASAIRRSRPPRRARRMWLRPSNGLPSFSSS